MERHVGAQRGLAHAGTPGKDQKVGRLQAAQQIVDIGEAGGDAGNAPAARLGLFGRLHRAAQRFVEIQRAFAVFVGFADGIERLFGLGDLVLGGLFGAARHRRC